LAWLLALGVLLALASFGALWWWGRRAPALDGARIQLDVPPGIGRRELAAELARQGLIEDVTLFRLYLQLLWPRAVIEAGPHLLARGSAPATLVACLARSPRPRVKLVIPEGYNQFQVARRLEESAICSASAFLAACRNPDVLTTLGVRGESAEGYLFPATYDFYLDARPQNVLKQLVQEATRRYESLAQQKADALARLAEGLGWSRHEIITLASIVEKESGVLSERGLIASVFYNRLQDAAFRPARMLQSDTTAAYGCLLDALLPSCARFSGAITPDMLRDPQNAYNTYKHAGLPPGPIANPGENAILAVLDPPSTPFLFFVAAPDGQGHVFSRTWAEHQAAVAELGARDAARRGVRP
jgi:UPF0755 protein